MQALYRQRGQIVQDWLTYPTQPCPIPGSTLTFQDLSESPVYLVDVKSNGPLPPSYEMNFPEDVEEAEQINFRHYLVECDSPRHDWSGITAPGVLIAEDIKRQKTDPARRYFNMSEISMAIYNHRFHPSTLRYVIFANVTNEETLFVGRGLYDLYRPSTDTQIWDYDSPEYQRFLGTRLGKLTAYMLLGACERGSRRIARIVTWTNPSFGTPWVRFDIQVVSPCDIPRSSIEPTEPVERPETIDRVIGEGLPIPLGEMLPPPAMKTPFGSMAPGQTVERQAPRTHVAGNLLEVGDGRVQAPRALHERQGDSSDTTSSDPDSNHPLARGSFHSRLPPAEASRDHKPTATSWVGQPEQDSTDISELSLLLAHLQIRDQPEAEAPRFVLQVPADHVSDELTRPSWDIDVEDLKSQAVADHTGSSLAPSEQLMEFLTPPEHPVVPKILARREPAGHIRDIGESSAPQPEKFSFGDPAVESASLSPVLPAFPALKLTPEPVGQKEEILLAPLAPVASPARSTSLSFTTNPKPAGQTEEFHSGSSASPVPGLAKHTDNVLGSQGRRAQRAWSLWRLVFFHFLLGLWRRMAKTKTS